jgi:hypothetical protein
MSDVVTRGAKPMALPPISVPVRARLYLADAASVPKAVEAEAAATAAATK